MRLFSLSLVFVTMVLASNKVIDREVLPATSSWPHRPVWLKASDETKVIGVSEKEALPLGIPVEFETPLFKGKLLLRLRNVKSDDPKPHKAYFDGRKRVMQTVVQGKFKKPIPMSDVYVGCVFKKPLEQAPPPMFVGMMNAVMKRVAPGVIFELDTAKPRVVALYAGTAETISIDTPGEEPDMTGADLPENLSRKFGSKFKSIKHRKQKLSLPKKAVHYEFDTENVYTFHTYDDKMDYGTYSITLPMYGDYNISKAIGRQPMSLTAVTSKGDTVYSFDLWHESVYDLELSGGI
jgi:hypothetical protein